MKSLIFSTLYRLGVARLLRRSKKGQLTILNLHRITDEVDPFFPPLRPQHFDVLLRHVKKHYQVTSFADLDSIDSRISKPYLILSFDDGYYDFVEYAMPILEKHRMKANHNIVNACANGTGLIWTERLNHLFRHCHDHSLDLSFEDEGLNLSLNQFGGDWLAFNIRTFLTLLELPREQRLGVIERKETAYNIQLERRMMNWHEIRQCADYGIDIGSHTYTHDAVGTIQDETLLQHEIAESRREMQEKIDRPVDIIALPNGQGNARVNAAAAEAGFKHVLYVGDRTTSLNELESQPLHILSRIGVIQESLPETALRIELFHAKFRR